MAQKSSNNSWNPLSYSQNLCVVSASNPSTGTQLNTSSDDNQLIDTFSAIDIKSDANSGINRLVNDLIANNGNELGFDCNQNLQTLSSSQLRNGYIADNVHNVHNVHSDGANNGVNCGHFALNGRNQLDSLAFADHPLSDGNGFGGDNRNNSVFNINSIPFVPKPDQMSSTRSSTRFAELPSFGAQNRPFDRPFGMSAQQLSHQMSQTFNNQISDSMKNPMFDPLSNPMPNHLSQSSVSGMTSNANQTAIQSLYESKDQTFAYNRDQTHQLRRPMEVLTQECNHPVNRQMRPIRARNLTPTVEPINKLNYYFDKSYEQFKHLERERKKIEYELIQAFVGQKISSANNIPIQRLPQNATKIDKIILDMSREHAKVITIVAKMEQLKGRELSEGIHNSVQKWVEIIRELQMKRKYEIQRNATNVANIALSDPVFIEQICQVLKHLWTTIRSVRTGLWSASVLTLYQKHFA